MPALLVLTACLDASTKDRCAVDSDCDPGRYCVAGTCSPTPPSTSCPPIANRTLWVDYFKGVGDAGNGGSPGCAYKNLLAAFAVVDDSGPWTVIVRGGENVVTNVTHAVPANVTIVGGTAGSGVGSASSFAACSDTNACPPSSWMSFVTSTTGAGGFVFDGAGARSLSYVSVVGPALAAGTGAPTSTAVGVTVSGGAALTVEHVRVRQFHEGVRVTSGGSFTATGDLATSDNDSGLVVDGGGSAQVTGLEANDNLADGIAVAAGSSLTLRGARVHDNRASGIHVVAGAGSLAAIDLGASASGAAAGMNQLWANAAANLCVDGGAASAEPARSLRALGNDFTDRALAQPLDKSCAMAHALSGAATCSGGVDVSDGNSGVVDVSACVVQ